MRLIAPRIRVYGDRATRMALRSLGSKVRRRILVAAMDAAMEPMYDAVLAEAPRDTGAMAAKVEKYTKGDTKGRMRVDIRIVQLASDVKYAGYVEFGVEARHREPDEFMLRAFDQESMPAVRNVTNLIRDGIEREANAS